MTKPLVFIIEDDRKLNEIFALSLRADFELETCMDGYAAIERLKSITPEILVLDLNLPVISPDIHQDIRAGHARQI